MKRWNRFLSLFLVIGMIISGMSVEVQGKDLLETEKKLERISGDNRVETAIKVSKEAYKGQVDTLFLAGYSGDADALTATFMAGEMNGPLLLADRHKISSRLFNEIKRLDPQEIIILGGENVVSEKIIDELEGAKYKTRRIRGRSRIETGVNLVNDYYGDKKLDEVFLVEYDSLVDALAIGPVAAKTGIPVLITKGDSISEEVEAFLKEKDIKKATIIGGEGTVSKEAMEELKGYVEKVSRVFGNDRIETSLNIAKKYFKDPKSIFIANGWKNADALIGGYFAGMEDGPMLLVNQHELREDSLQYISETDVKAYALGGEAVISSYVYSLIDWILEDMTFPQPKPEPKPEEVEEELGPEEIEAEEVQPGEENKDQVGEEVPADPTSILGDKKYIEGFLKKGVDSRKDKITMNLSPKFTNEEIEELITSMQYTGSYGSGNLSEIRYSLARHRDKIEIVINMKYLTTRGQEDFIDKEVKRIIGQIIKPGMSEFEKVKEVHDYIVDNSMYSRETNTTSHSAYTLLKEGKGVCSAYAFATIKFLDELGIENYYMTGQANNGSGSGYVAHGWNKLKLDGDWYNMDVTWDDPLTENSQNSIRYKYFLISDQRISKSHRARLNSFPKARSEKYEALCGISNPYEYKGKIYYGNEEDNYKLYSISLDDLIPRKILDNLAPYLVVHRDKIFFSNYSNGGYIYRVDLNGENLEKLNNVHSTNLKFENPYLKFINYETGQWEKIDIS